MNAPSLVICINANHSLERAGHEPRLPITIASLGPPFTATLDRMKPKRFILGPVENPTWKDFALRVGGALGVIAIAILVSREFIPGHVGTAVVTVSVALVAFVAIQEWRQKKACRKGKNN